MFDEIKEVICETLSCDEDKVTLEASLTDDLGADSLDAVELGMAIEDKIGVTIADEDLPNIKTVQDLVETICTANNITLATQTIPNGDFTINDPTREGDEPTVMTDRQMLSYACQCIGCFAKMDENGQMIIGWYDFENPVQITSTFDGKSLWTTPIEVTGIRVTLGGGGVLMAVSIDANGDLLYMRSSEVSDTFTINSSGELIATAENGVVYTIVNEELIRTGEEITSDSDNSESVEILYGTDDRVIKLEENPYITTSNVARVCQIISEQILVTDNITGLVYLIPITSTDYNKGLIQNINCSFEDKEDSDLRPSASYSVRASVDNALRQAQQADAIAQMAQEMAEQSGYQPVVVSNRGGAFLNDGTATLTAVIYDRDANEVDPQGTDMNYRWWVTQDGQTGTYLDGGKNITVAVNDSLCDYAAGIYFETRSAEDGIYPFCLSNRNGLVLQTRSGKMLTVDTIIMIKCKISSFDMRSIRHIYVHGHAGHVADTGGGMLDGRKTDLRNILNSPFIIDDPMALDVIINFLRH